MQITEAHALKLKETIDAGLVNGLGNPIPGQMCIEAAFSYALGLPHTDNPTDPQTGEACVTPYLRSLKIALNDKLWSSKKARAKGLRRLGLAQLGSFDAVDNAELRRRVVEMTIRKVLPLALRAAAKRNPKHASSLEIAAVGCETKGTREAAVRARQIANAADAAAYAANAADAAAYAANAADAANAANAAAYAANAADAANAAAYAANAADAAAAYAANADTRDRVLSQFAEWVVEILIDMRAPGAQWLYLVPKDETL